MTLQHSSIALIDDILWAWQPVLGVDYQGYRNHVLRMSLFCELLRPCSAEERHKIAIAACFHDIGLWTDNTLDYLPPSLPPALTYLAEQGLSDWAEEISQMILQHHKIRAISNPQYALVELFRRADLVDFSLGTVRFGLSRAVVRQVQSEFPNAGFHRMLLKRTGRWLVKHPLNPAPMIKW